MEFKEYELGTIIECHDKKRKPLSTIQRAKIKGQYPYYGAQEIIDYINDYIFDGRYILLAEDGENLRSGIKPLLKIVNNKFWLNNHAHIFTCKEGYNLEYLYYALLKYDFQPYITGTTQPKLNQENMMKIKIKLPELEIQNKISKILCRIDKKIDLNNQMNNNLLHIGMELLKDNFNKTNNFEVLSNVINFIKGKRPSNITADKQEGYEKYLTIACLNEQELNYADTTKMIMSNNDLLMVMDGASSGDVYYAGYGIVGSTLARIDCLNNKYISEFIYFVMKYYKELIQSKNTGSAIPHTDKIFVSGLKIPKLSLENQERYRVLLSKIQQNNVENANLIKLRDTLIPKLMNGEIDLDEIEV